MLPLFKDKLHSTTIRKASTKYKIPVGDIVNGMSRLSTIENIVEQSLLRRKQAAGKLAKRYSESNADSV